MGPLSAFVFVGVVSLFAGANVHANDNRGAAPPVGPGSFADRSLRQDIVDAQARLPARTPALGDTAERRAPRLSVEERRMLREQLRQNARTIRPRAARRARP